MSTSFNFGNLDSQSVVATNKVLKPWGIYEVKFEGIEQNEMKGKKNPDAVYHTLKLSFSGEEGNFTTNLFIPQNPAEDCVRAEQEYSNGGKGKRASRFDEFEMKVLQLCGVVNPEGFEKMKQLSAAGKIKSMDDFLKIALKVANAKKGVTTNLKLLGRTTDGKTYADLPRIARIIIDEAGNEKCVPRDNYVGNNLAFTDFQANLMQEYQNAKPTNMEDSNLAQAEKDDKGNDDLADLDL